MPADRAHRGRGLCAGARARDRNAEECAGRDRRHGHAWADSARHRRHDQWHFLEATARDACDSHPQRGYLHGPRFHQRRSALQSGRQAAWHRQSKRPSRRRPAEFRSRCEGSWRRLLRRSGHDARGWAELFVPRRRHRTRDPRGARRQQNRPRRECRRTRRPPRGRSVP